MNGKLSQIKGYLTPRKTSEGNSKSDRQIGFKISFCEATRDLKVKVIGARNLPNILGSIKPTGYLMKVTVFPQREKFETKTVADSWPIINEEFSFNLMLPCKKPEDYFRGKFVSFTVYAIMGEEETSPKEKRNKGMLKRFLSFNDTDLFSGVGTFQRTSSSRRSSYRHSLTNRRLIGNVTYNLDSKVFTQKFKNNFISTPDIWRSLTEITNGIQTPQRDGQKGSIELTLQYAVSEDGTNDVVEITVTKFRCSLQTMLEHERIGGQLYIKITAFEMEDLLQTKKSDKFQPTISLRIEAKTATLRATVNNYNIRQVKILIRLISKNLLGKKVVLGKIEIDSKNSFWKEIVATPLVPITKMVHFE